MKASIIIRVKNEEKWLPSVLEMLEKQTEQDFEVILVDDHSIDKTVNIFNKSRIKEKRIINFEKPFNYPYAANLGAKNAKGKYLFFLSGHSVPDSRKFIESGIKHLKNEGVAGVHGWCTSLSDASLTEKAFYHFAKYYKKTKIHKKIRMGVLGLTNAGIRKDLWEEYNFNEEHFSKGGEDTEWAGHFMNKGYKIIFEPEMLVYHSHGIGLLKFIKQYLHWAEVGKRAILFNKE